MKSIFALVTLASLPLFASSETKRYVVVSDRPAIHSVERNVVRFDHVDSYAVDLTDAQAAALRHTARLVEPVAPRHILGFGSRVATTAFRNVSGQTIPTGLDLVGARDAWRFSRGEDINVVVMDTGVDYRHPDLAGAYAGGFNAITGSDDAMDDHGHGTHVAGIVAARDDEAGVVGVAPRTRLWAVKALLSNGSGTTEHVVSGLNWVIAQKRARGGNWIVNMSFGWHAPNNAEANAVSRALDEGILLVGGSGNDSTDTIAAQVIFPAAYPGVFAIGAVDASRSRALFSNQGPRLGAVAPGVDILSTVLLGGGILTGFAGDGFNETAIALEGSGKGSATGRIVDCGVGRFSDFTAAVAGQIALIRRGGDILFADKARRAKGAGAAAVIFVNYPGQAVQHFTLINVADRDAQVFQWPIAMAVSHEEGARLLATGTPVTVVNQVDDYTIKSGTSMASPHAAAVAALVWAASPTARAVDVINALKLSAADLGPKGADTVYGHGMIHAVDAARMLNPALVDAAFPTPSGRRILRRGR